MADEETGKTQKGMGGRKGLGGGGGGGGGVTTQPPLVIILAMGPGSEGQQRPSDEYLKTGSGKNSTFPQCVYRLITMPAPRKGAGIVIRACILRQGRQVSFSPCFPSRTRG
jgi:hypothetical protein